jgi:small subunit ribosomal protein S6
MPSIAITQPYEAVYIVDPDLGDERISAITAKYRQIVESGGGTLEKIDVWERRRLAYEIKGRTEGIYVVMQFRSKPPVEAELRRIFQISEDQIRFLIIRRDDEEALLPVSPPAPAISAPAASTAAAPAAEPAAITETPEPVQAAEAVQPQEAATTTEAVTEPAETPEPA